ncbi:MAG: hypothetical protein KAX44_04640, partial [Candidatus Brocadiae bacterium]|nr:hypothetical protein [Candidatus Brocadiia bacterium]
MDSTLSRTTAPVLVLLALLGFGGGVVCADVVAVVSGEPISRADFGLSLVRSLGRSALETLVDWALVEQEARRLGIEPTDADLAARKELEVELGMRAVMEKSRTGPQQFRAAAQRYEWDLGALRSELEESISDNGLRIQLMVERMLEPRMDLGEEALRKHYDRTRGERYSGAHVLVASRRHAESLLRALRDNPELWTEAVLQSSLDRPSVPYRGRIRPVPASSELGKVFAGMDADELRLHCDGEYWHVCQFIEKIPAAEESFEDTRDQLKAELVVLKAREGFHALLARLNANANIVMNLSTVPGARQLLGEEVAAFVNGEPLWIADL